MVVSFLSTSNFWICLYAPVYMSFVSLLLMQCVLLATHDKQGLMTKPLYSLQACLSVCLSVCLVFPRSQHNFLLTSILQQVTVQA